MSQQNPNKQPIAIVSASFNTLVRHPAILFPFSVLAFIQLLTLELIYFAPREPLINVFGPLIRWRSGEVFTHYPYNFILLISWYQKAQIPIYIIFSTFFIGVAVAVIHIINNDDQVDMKKVFLATSARYVHLMVYGLIMVTCLSGISRLYQMLAQKIWEMPTASGVWALVKSGMVTGGPYVHLFLAVLVTTLFAFVVPLVVIEKKKIFPALAENFRCLKGSFFFLFSVVFLPVIIYLPLLLIRSQNALFVQGTSPEWKGMLLVISTLVLLFIDALQYTAITTFYLFKKEMA